MTLAEDVRRVLADRASPLSQVMKAVSAAEKAFGGAPAVAIGLSSNVTIDLLGTFLRREALLAGMTARIVPGGYDDPIGDMARFSGEGVEQVLLLPFFDNVLPAFEAQLGVLPDEVLAAKLAEMRARYRLALEGAAAVKTVHLALGHRLGRPAAADGMDAVDAALSRFNAMLREEAAAFANVQLIDIADLVGEVGRANAFDDRFYYRAKAPYSAALLSALAARIAIASRGFGSYYYKALALDCDNTLWGGIIGEDLIDGIKLGPHGYPSNIFWSVQQAIAGLEKAGLLLCLCTKNNPADVEEVLRDHPDMVLRAAQFIVKRVNWDDKVANLQAIANELNIGLDSLIFLDDSPVEVESVRTRLPMVRTIQVPASLPNYPRVIDEIAALYLGGGVSAESRSKTEQYRSRAAAAELQTAFGSHEEYLASLELEVDLHVDDRGEVPRISELSMKSNQFNLTTTRYGQAEVVAMIDDAASEAITVTVRNKFGNSGLTGIVVLRFAGDVARIENFLMSCRVLGQGVEFALWNPIAERCRARGCTAIEAEFRPTAKNAQARDFYDRLGLELIGDEGGVRRYRLALAAFAPPQSSWIKVTHV